MADLDNRRYAENPWRVTLRTSAPDAEGWRAGSLRLVREAVGDAPAASIECEAALYERDLDRLVAALRSLADADEGLVEFEPLEPSFLVHGRSVAADDVELAWFVDEGMRDSTYSTGTGAGVLLRVDAAVLRAFADALEAEGAG
ncbi:hypothetical protein [Miniimonas sp. S16]|uniref:WapI family immunity protein n=1 Tax=Miniimonas sp. S16 TaxID=2171623 RepID=UPI000D526525|nr:hypothetical protein [Miniimonas sp. S16]